MRRFFVTCLFLFLCTAAHVAHADTLTLTAGSSATTTPNVATSITGFQIVGPAEQTTPVKIRATSGTLNLSVVSGVTMSGNGSGTVSLSGTVEKLNTALSTLTYTRGSTGTDTLEVSLVEATEVFFTDNGHLYKFITGSINATDARTEAANQTAYGATGYLATITSQDENDFVAARLQGDGWIGGSDEGTEGVWKWVTGPEAGTTFWNGTFGGSSPDGQYANWSFGEPNDWSNGNPGEDCVQFYISSSNWNDLHCTENNLAGYVVEFGTPDDEPTVVAQNISIVTADVPTITSFSPANSATNVSATANLVIGFSKTVTPQTGNVVIKKVSDDTTVETIDVTGELLSGSGTNSITINPVNAFEEGVQYYVTVPSTAFKDSSDNFFAGFTASSTWAFTTADETAPVLSDITATNIATTTASITWSTNESASSQVVYSPGNTFASSTVEINTSPRVTSHSVDLEDLTACTTYNFKAVAEDGVGNYATSTSNLFTTLGCPSFAVPTNATTSTVTVSSSATSSLSESGRTLTVETPANFTATSSTVVIQIKSLTASTVLAALGTPGSVSVATSIVFDVKALIDGSIELDSFDQPVTMTHEYTDEDVSGLDESSIWMYHYRDGAWSALDNCSVDTGANTITCTAPHFSIFGLFGSAPTASANASVSTPQRTGASVAGRVRNLLEMGNTARAQELMNEYPKVFAEETSVATTQSVNTNGTPAASKTCSLAPINRVLKTGSEGEDVRALQQFLNCAGFVLDVAGPGSHGNETTVFAVKTYNALVAFQEFYTADILAPLQLTRGTGIFGPRSLEKALSL